MTVISTITFAQPPQRPHVEIIFGRGAPGGLLDQNELVSVHYFEPGAPTGWTPVTADTPPRATIHTFARIDGAIFQVLADLIDGRNPKGDTPNAGSRPDQHR